MGDTTATIAWGVPVDIVDFLCSFDAFRKAIPTILTLRLCNQFGTGENTGITKLPKELIENVGEVLLASLRREEMRAGHRWPMRYGCFEGSCRPLYHVDQLRIMDEEVEHVERELLEAHPEWQTAPGMQYPEEFINVLEHRLVQSVEGIYGDYLWELCDDRKQRWQSDVLTYMDRDGNGDLLRKYFGLDTFIMHGNLDPSIIKYLERSDKRHSSGGPETEKATICYLILPSSTEQWETRPDKTCEHSEYCWGESATSILVDRSSLALTDAQQRRFTRAMRRLDLKPSVHPSQLQKAPSGSSTTGAPASVGKSVSEEEETKEDSVITKRIKDLQQSEWPKLMLLASQSFSGL